LINIVYFSWVRDAIGLDGEQITPTPTMRDMRDVCKFLATRSDGHARAFADLSRLRVAVDLAMADFDAPIANAREIAFFPPVTGG
jgi:sulfur-carrier protein